MNIILYGGSFDPIHKGHIEIAKASKSNNIDEIWFIPTYKSWIKGNATSFDIRCEMVSIAIKNYDYMKLKTYEKDLVDKNNIDYSYTSELIKFLKSKYNNYKFYFLCGIDSIFDIKTWHNYEYILKNIDFIIANREDNRTINIKEYLNNLNFNYILLNNSNINISSTDIKNDIEKYKSYLNENIYKYIKDHKLYI